MAGNQLSWIPAVQQFSQYINEYTKQQRENNKELLLKKLSSKYLPQIMDTTNMNEAGKLVLQAQAEGLSHGVDIMPIVSNAMQTKYYQLQDEFTQKERQRIEEEREQEKLTNEQVKQVILNDIKNKKIWHDGGIVEGNELIEQYGSLNPVAIAKLYPMLSNNILSPKIEVTGKGKEGYNAVVSLEHPSKGTVESKSIILRQNPSKQYYIDKNNNNKFDENELASVDELKAIKEYDRYIKSMSSGDGGGGSNQVKYTTIHLKDGSTIKGGLSINRNKDGYDVYQLNEFGKYIKIKDENEIVKIDFPKTLSSFGSNRGESDENKSKLKTYNNAVNYIRNEDVNKTLSNIKGQGIDENIKNAIGTAMVLPENSEYNEGHVHSILNLYRALVKYTETTNYIKSTDVNKTIITRIINQLKSYSQPLLEKVSVPSIEE